MASLTPLCDMYLSVYIQLMKAQGYVLFSSAEP